MIDILRAISAVAYLPGVQILCNALVFITERRIHHGMAERTGS